MSEVDIITRAGEIVSFRPSNPVEMEFLIRELSEVIEQMPERLLELNQKRYETERAWSRKFNTALAQYSQQMSVTAARATALVEALDARETADNAKAAWHYADDSQKALTSKLYGLLNVNKGVQAAYNTFRGGQ